MVDLNSPQPTQLRWKHWVCREVFSAKDEHVWANAEIGRSTRVEVKSNSWERYGSGRESTSSADEKTESLKDLEGRVLRENRERSRKADIKLRVLFASTMNPTD